MSEALQIAMDALERIRDFEDDSSASSQAWIAAEALRDIEREQALFASLTRNTEGK